MSKTTLLCGDLPNIPWQDKPACCTAPLWRYSDNPVIRRNPLPGVARIFNSAVMPYEGAYIGVFRGEQTNGIPYIYLGRSADGIHWTFDPEKIPFVNEKGEPAMPVYAYDPRLVKVEDTYYIIWCQDFYGASIGLAKTTDFKTFTRLENPFVPLRHPAGCSHRPHRPLLRLRRQLRRPGLYHGRRSGRLYQDPRQRRPHGLGAWRALSMNRRLFLRRNRRLSERRFFPCPASNKRRRPC